MVRWHLFIIPSLDFVDLPWLVEIFVAYVWSMNLTINWKSLEESSESRVFHFWMLLIMAVAIYYLFSAILIFFYSLLKVFKSRLRDSSGLCSLSIFHVANVLCPFRLSFHGRGWTWSRPQRLLKGGSLSTVEPTRLSFLRWVPLCCQCSIFGLGVKLHGCM